MYVTIASYKGGVGKSTTALHLAYYLAVTRSRRVVLVDQDPNRTCLDWAARSEKPPAFDVVDLDSDTDPGDYDDVVIDTQARPGPDLLEALSGPGNFLVVPSGVDAMAIAALLKTVDGLTGNYRILLAQVPTAPSKASAYARALLEGYPLFEASIRRYAAYEKASAYGMTVDQVRSLDRNAGLAWSDYKSVGGELWQRTH